MTSDLPAFLRARLDDDEQTARAAGAELGPDWRYNAEGRWVRAVWEDDGIATGHQDYLGPEYGHHIARHDPARVLREVEAKRRIIGLCETETAETGGLPLALRTLRLLALPYADHPDYREEWRP